MANCHPLHSTYKRNIKNLPFLAHTREHFIDLGILNVDQLYKFIISVYIFKCFNIPFYDTSLLSFMSSNENNIIHHHNTRNNFINLPLFKLNTTQSSMFYSGVKTWNELPA